MCGLFGIVNLEQQVPIDVEKARVARDRLAHRGPNQAGEWFDSANYIGHRRLSILDISEAGRQPMISEDGKTIIAVNGEIYNFKELRQKLERAGTRFQSYSDSEVILHGFRAWGIQGLLDKIDGMYAFAVFDRIDNKIYLARDRVGIKPLYYSRLNGQLSWASELKALVSYIGKSKLHADNEALYDFLTYRYIPSPKSAYKGIYKLPPAHYLTLSLDSGEFSVNRYWSLPTKIDPLDDELAARRVRETLRDAVAAHLMSDVPVGFFLSGGLDSSIVTAQARELDYSAHTFSIGFGVDGFDETEYAELVASHLGTEHSTSIIGSDTASPLVEWLENLFDEPFAENSALPTWHVADQASDSAVVVLTGDGADELFGGYSWYFGIESTLAFKRLFKFVPESISSFDSRRLKSLANVVAASKSADPELAIYNARYFSPMHVRAKELWREKLQVDADYDDMWFFKQFWKPELGARRAFQYLDFHTFLPECVLTKVDRTTMAHSIEARVPFLARKMIELAFSLPEQFLYKNGHLKGGLKYAFKESLPNRILSRGKKGFSLPWDEWRYELIGDAHTLQEAVLEEFLRAEPQSV